METKETRQGTELGRTYNLLKEAWIPVLREDGTLDWIAPHQITEGLCRDGKVPIMRLNSNRADFNAAIAQFLIGLFQTAFAPDTEAEWEYDYEHPPTPVEIEEAFEAYQEFFWLDGEGARFMQDKGAKEPPKAKKKSDTLGINQLLFDEINKSSIEMHKDHFIKQKNVQHLSLQATAMAIFIAQIHATPGGSGHRSALRGSKFLTTIAQHQRGLWNSIWLNIIPINVLTVRLQGKNINVEQHDIFPWLQPPTSQNNEFIAPLDVHPLTVYWSMPQRQWMNCEANNHKPCDIYGKDLHEEQQANNTCVFSYYKRHHGGNYKGLWLHPLSPVQEGIATQSLSSAKLPEAALGYHHWLGILQTVTDKSITKKPALVIDYLLNTAKYIDRATTRWQFVQQQEQQRNQHRQEPKDTSQALSDITVWTFGLDNNNDKINTWLDSQIPIIYVSGEYRNDFEMTVKDMILTAQDAAAKLKKAFTTAAKRQSSLVALDATLANAVEERFWRSTETEFYQRLQNLKKALEKEQPNTSCIETTKREWKQYVRGQAESIFLASLTPSHLRSNPKQYILGMKELKK